jgi:tRNA 2-thiouridine synthesizing protein A
MQQLDARGLSCPEPVLRARRVIQTLGSGSEVEVLVETVTSRENVTRAARSLGCEVRVDAREDGYHLWIRKP